MNDNSRIRGLDGLRAAAMTLVFFEHKTSFGHKFNLGVGVILFFVLSGYLITGILLNRRLSIEANLSSTKIEMVSFFLNRSFRIFPAYYTMLIFITIFSLTIYPIISLHEMPFYATYTTNIMVEFVNRSWPNLGHLWTLSIEEQFYIVAAPFFLLAASRHAKYVVASILSAGAVALSVLLSTHAEDISIATDSLINFDVLAVGSAVAVASVKRSNGTASWVIVLAIIGLLLPANFEAISHIHVSHTVFKAISTLFAAVAIWAVIVNQESVAVGVLNWSPIRMLGRVSYSFYLWHYVINFEFLRPTIDVLIPTEYFQSVIVCLLDYVATLAIAVASWRLLESPLLQLRDRLVGKDMVARKIAYTKAEPPEDGSMPSVDLAIPGSATRITSRSERHRSSSVAR
jgi:peptidoglycan/LPS O-acetylase OafA/YrhL